MELFDFRNGNVDDVRPSERQTLPLRALLHVTARLHVLDRSDLLLQVLETRADLHSLKKHRRFAYPRVVRFKLVNDVVLVYDCYRKACKYIITRWVSK